jgi:orotate phosphoribosyltransferase
VQEVQQTYGLPVCAIANLDSLLKYIENQKDMLDNLRNIREYRHNYGC